MKQLIDVEACQLQDGDLVFNRIERVCRRVKENGVDVQALVLISFTDGKSSVLPMDSKITILIETTDIQVIE